MLSVYARHAKSGELFAINIEDGIGERYPAGDDSIELKHDEVDALRAEYGWQESQPTKQIEGGSHTRHVA